MCVAFRATSIDAPLAARASSELLDIHHHHIKISRVADPVAVLPQSPSISPDAPVGTKCCQANTPGYPVNEALTAARSKKASSPTFRKPHESGRPGLIKGSGRPNSVAKRMFMFEYEAAALDFEEQLLASGMMKGWSENENPNNPWPQAIVRVDEGAHILLHAFAEVSAELARAIEDLKKREIAVKDGEFFLKEMMKLETKEREISEEMRRLTLKEIELQLRAREMALEERVMAAREKNYEAPAVTRLREAALKDREMTLMEHIDQLHEGPKLAPSSGLAVGLDQPFEERPDRHVQGLETPWNRMVYLACSSFNVELAQEKPLLGFGTVGRRFKVELADGNVAALKVVLAEDRHLLEEEAEVLQMKACQDTGVAVKLLSPLTFLAGGSGAAILISPVGQSVELEELKKESVLKIFHGLFRLHQGRIVHGNAGLPSLIRVEEEYLWIDFLDSNQDRTDADRKFAEDTQFMSPL
ncbi:hypothetical protein HDU96_006982 [Phlyctochytrium bullatum]|nr:hypothetical protein HDU96_006982 [Phlyctochytrium bullatum]